VELDACVMACHGDGDGVAAYMWRGVDGVEAT
jgi:hypothetical protein